MSIYDFKLNTCGKCFTQVWVGVSWSGFRTKLDMTPLNLEMEILAKVKGLTTFEIHPTDQSFEVVPRTLNRIIWAQALPKRKRVILAQHLCQASMQFAEQPPPPDYWDRRAKEIQSSEGYPF